MDNRPQTKGLAYLALKFEWNADKFGSLPTVQAIIKGRKVYDPNLDGQFQVVVVVIEKTIVQRGHIQTIQYYSY